MARRCALSDQVSPSRFQGAGITASRRSRRLEASSSAAVVRGEPRRRIRRGTKGRALCRADDRIYVESEPDWRGRRITFSLARVLRPLRSRSSGRRLIETGSQASAIADADRADGRQHSPGTSVIVDQAPSNVRTQLNVVGLLRYDEFTEGELNRPRTNSVLCGAMRGQQLVAACKVRHASAMRAGDSVVTLLRNLSRAIV